MELKKNTTYRLSKADKEFAMELAKIGHVHFLSDQVTLKAMSEKSLSFKEYGEKSCDGLVLPENWVIEFVGVVNGGVSITFGIKKL